MVLKCQNIGFYTQKKMRRMACGISTQKKEYFYYFFSGTKSIETELMQ